MNDERVKRIGLVAVALLTALAVARIGVQKARRFLAREPDARLVPLDGESAVLPRRAPSAAGGGGERGTRTSRQTIDVDGAARRYVLVEPQTIVAGRAYPLVLVFHGDGGDGAGFHEGFPLERGSGDRAVLAYPDAPRGWDLETTRDNRDVRFIETLVDQVAARFTIDRTRIFAAGYSKGGFFANVLACQRSGLVRAISSSAGGAPYGQAERHPNGYPKCPGQEPVAALALHGRNDFGVTIDSGRFSAAYWAYVNGCRTDEIEPTGYAECTAYRGCPAGKAVAFCDVPGLSHWVWDRAAEATWTFFETQAP